jgi:polyphosphate kinase
LSFDADIPTDLLNYLIKSLNFGKEDALIPGSRYHNFKDFMKFPDLGQKHLKYQPLPPVPHPDIKPREKIITKIREKDIMLNFPYHSFDNFIDLLREAAIDPKVRSIKITLYRLGQKSSVINALINATRNGKQVTAIVELTARFDEQANIKWSNRLRDHGVKVIYGVQDLKVHAKLVLIERKEKKRTALYACVGTGNFNEDTTSVFSDHLLLTADRRITTEVLKIFNFFDKNYKISLFRHLIVSPFYMRNKLNKLINNEIKNAKEGKKAFIYIKMNNVVDERIIYKLYEASQVGVDVRMNVRGMFSMVPGLPGISDKLQAVAMIDRFLEHSRIMIFHNNGWEQYYISSADLMARNLDRRVEVACPVYDPELQKELKSFFDIQWNDNTQLRILDKDLSNRYIPKAENEEQIRSQIAWYNYMKSKI